MAAMAGLIWFGIFEQCPELKVIHVEGDGGWTPYWLQRMEQHWNFSGNAEHEYLTRVQPNTSAATSAWRFAATSRR